MLLFVHSQRSEGTRTPSAHACTGRHSALYSLSFSLLLQGMEGVSNPQAAWAPFVMGRLEGCDNLIEPPDSSSESIMAYESIRVPPSFSDTWFKALSLFLSLSLSRFLSAGLKGRLGDPQAVGQPDPPTVPVSGRPSWGHRGLSAPCCNPRSRTLSNTFLLPWQPFRDCSFATKRQSRHACVTGWAASL